VRWSRRALSDVAGIYAYIAADNAESAVRMADRLLAAGESLTRFPQIGRPGRLAGRRELVVDRHVVTYSVRRGEVHILAVEHGAQRRCA
jgi:plasmid stabilization system protein ParE